jgi:hypothetical protein
MSDSIIYGCGGGANGETTCGNVVFPNGGGSGGGAVHMSSSGAWTTNSGTTSSGMISMAPNSSLLVTIPEQQRETKMNCGIQYDCVVPSYGYPGFNILESCVGLGLLVLAVAAGYYIYRRACNYYDVTGLVQDKD